MYLALHKAMGGHSAIVVDIDPVKRAAAKTAGARQVIDGGARDAAQQIVAATNGGAWAAIDLVGSSGTARLAIDSLIKGGKLIVVGLYGGDITVPLPFFPMRAIAGAPMWAASPRWPSCSTSSAASGCRQFRSPPARSPRSTRRSTTCAPARWSGGSC